MIRILFFALLFSFSSFSTNSGKEFSEEQSKTYIVYINYSDYSVHASVLFDSRKIHPKIGYNYYWYSDNDIKQTDGGFDGKLLHGEYKSFYLYKNLKEQGNFSYGLKQGLWKTWYDNGKIHELIHYKNSLEHGSYEKYDESGNLISKSNFKNGTRNGKMFFYQNGKIDSIVNYKNGKVISSACAKKSGRVTDKSKSSIKKKADSTNLAQDTIAKNPKSSFSVKKIFNKAPFRIRSESKTDSTQNPIAKKNSNASNKPGKEKNGNNNQKKKKSPSTSQPKKS